MEVCYWALLFMPLVILHHLLNVFVQLANKRGFKKKKIIAEKCGCANGKWLTNSKTNFKTQANNKTKTRGGPQLRWRDQHRPEQAKHNPWIRTLPFPGRSVHEDDA
jgi:hypothetical protein